MNTALCNKIIYLRIFGTYSLLKSIVNVNCSRVLVFQWCAYYNIIKAIQINVCKCCDCWSKASIFWPLWTFQEFLLIQNSLLKSKKKKQNHSYHCTRLHLEAVSMCIVFCFCFPVHSPWTAQPWIPSLLYCPFSLHYVLQSWQALHSKIKACYAKH